MQKIEEDVHRNASGRPTIEAIEGERGEEYGDYCQIENVDRAEMIE